MRADADQYRIRPADDADLPAILAIYNEAIATTTATFDLEPKSLDDRRTWLRNRTPKHPVVVVEDISTRGEVLGWASLSPWSDRAGYRITAEPSLYLDTKARGRGIGHLLMEWICAEAARHGFRSLISRVDATNELSVSLHLKHGFTQIGTLPQSGLKFGKLIDVALLQWMNPNFRMGAWS